MGILAYYDRITSEQLEALRREPEKRSEILGYKADPERCEARHLDIDKSWDEINRMLNGEVHEGSGPLWNAVMGGTDLVEVEIDPDDENSWEGVEDK